MEEVREYVDRGKRGAKVVLVCLVVMQWLGSGMLLLLRGCYGACAFQNFFGKYSFDGRKGP